MQVLILGNGISRLSFQAQILGFAGEIWATNRAYTERKIGPKLARLTGHREVLEEAYKAKQENKELRFELWGGHTGKVLSFCQPFTVGPKWLRDSGTTLVAQALHEGRKVTVCGFDLGGPDIHSPGLWRFSKHNWVDRWIEIFIEWGPDCVQWIGHDHRQYIQDCRYRKKSNRTYSLSHSRRRPHIPGPEYLEEFKKYMDNHKLSSSDKSNDVMRVVWRNGYRGTLRAHLAEIYAARGQVKILGKYEEPNTEPEPVKQESSAAKVESKAEQPPAPQQKPEKKKKKWSGGDGDAD